MIIGIRQDVEEESMASGQGGRQLTTTAWLKERSGWKWLPRKEWRTWVSEPQS